MGALQLDGDKLTEAWRVECSPHKILQAAVASMGTSAAAEGICMANFTG